MCVHVCVCKPEEDAVHLSQLPPVFLSKGLMEFTDLVRLAGQYASGILLPPVPSTEIIGVHYHHPLHVGYGDPSSCLHVRILQLRIAWCASDFKWVPFGVPRSSLAPVQVLSPHTHFATVCQDLSFCNWCLTATPRSSLRICWVRSGKKHITEKTCTRRFSSTTSPILE